MIKVYNSITNERFTINVSNFNPDNLKKLASAICKRFNWDFKNPTLYIKRSGIKCDSKSLFLENDIFDIK